MSTPGSLNILSLPLNAPVLTAPNLFLTPSLSPLLRAETPLAAAIDPLRPAVPAKAKRPKKPASRHAAAKLETLSAALAATPLDTTSEARLSQTFDGSRLTSQSDVTTEYQTLLENSSRTSLRAVDALELAELRKFKVLLVPGFLSGAFIRLGNHTAWSGRRYFGDQIDWLKANGIEYELADVHTAHSVEHNAPIVARAIENSDKPVIAITHSMGGKILLETLITRPELRARVRGWAPVQAPFRGSHLADLPAIGGVSTVLRLFGGTEETVAAMTTARSRVYNRRHREDIADIVRAIPVVAFASWVDTSAPRWLLLANPLLKWTWDLVSWSGGRNDILVPAKSAALPGMEYISIAGVDHFSPFIDTAASFDRVRFLKTMLTMLLRRTTAS